MNIKKLEGYDLIALEVAQDRRLVTLKVVSKDDKVYGCFFHNEGTEKVGFAVNHFDITIIYDEDKEYPTLGELEYITVENNLTVLEGDFGWIEIVSDKREFWEL